MGLGGFETPGPNKKGVPLLCAVPFAFELTWFMEYPFLRDGLTPLDILRLDSVSVESNVNGMQVQSLLMSKVWPGRKDRLWSGKRRWRFSDRVIHWRWVGSGDANRRGVFCGIWRFMWKR